MIDSWTLIKYGGIGVASCFLITQIHQRVSYRRKLKRWSKTPKDVVILHGFPRQRTIPSISPFVLKVETYLRMTNICYEFDSVDFFGPTGKTPWISINGEHISDSELAIAYLAKKFQKNVNKSYSEEKLAIGTATRVMLEEHSFWGLARDAYLEKSTRHVPAANFYFPELKMPRCVMFYIIRRNYTSYLWSQGLGRLSIEDARTLIRNEFKSAAVILGNNKYFLGDEPSQVDCAIFGFFAQMIWGWANDSAFSHYNSILDDYPNVVDYCNRMKDKYWPDWNYCLAKI